ncbi:LLM class flavin-dependent oxidoreductase [Egicoccus sp. AB-alg2]|uniref:LLM class flavin-dependent oxidoreductase n=1 Tax=Egicoccus sp. AB-alg2 TaxID=3242693 RepID=UPI00359D0DF4
MVRFSYVQLPDYPLDDCIDMIKTADELGFYAAYSVDETWHKDMWLLFAAAADKTRNIRMGPNVTHVILKEPTILAQQLATLDELTNGRAEAVVSFGNLGMLEQYHIDWSKQRPLARLREGHDVMRTFLDEGVINHEGEFFNYTGLFTFARPVQEHVPIKLGGMGGPKSFELAGEISDGLHHALGYSRENYDYVAEHFRIGAEKAGRNPEELDLGAWLCWSVAEDGEVAKQAARIMVAFYISSMPESQLQRHGLSREGMQPILDALGQGEIDRAIELTSPEIAAKLSVAGTPEECIEQLKRDILPTGVNHVIAAVTDAKLVETFSGKSIEGVPVVQDQLRLIAERVMPALS